jgi:DNA polymerase elongation subunit (family B)
MKIICFDIETTGLNPFNKDAVITSVCAKNSEGYELKGYLKHDDLKKDNTYRTAIDDRELNLIVSLMEFIAKHPEHTLLTKNGTDFDIPYFLTRSIRNSGRHMVYDINIIHKILLHRKHIDIQQWTKRRISLQTMCELFGIKGKTLANGEGAIQLWKDHRYQKLMNYCMNDVNKTIELFNLRNKLIRYNS